MNKKGFTLIELLAVIVILAIIALIVTPVILNIIKNAQEGADKRSIEQYAKIIKEDYLERKLKDSSLTLDNYLINFVSETTYDGDKIVCEQHNVINKEIELKNCTVGGRGYYNYIDGKAVKGETVVENTNTNNNETNNTDSNDNDEVIEIGLTALEPTCTLVSDADNSGLVSAGDEYICKVKDNMETGYEDGYTFFVLDVESDKVDLILDRNIYYDPINDVGLLATSTNMGLVGWIISDYAEYGPITAMDYLYEATKDWDNIPNIEINYTDEGKIYGTIKTSDGTTTITKKDGITKTSVYDNLKARIPEKNEKTYLGDVGYWTLSSYDSESAFYVSSEGQLYSKGTSYAKGIRPVIQISTNSEYTPKEVEETQFSKDSWSTIISNVKSGDTIAYNVGDKKEMKLTGEVSGTYTVRIANNSTPSECSQEGFSQTACGFVIEFVDIITTHNMNSTHTNVGGWRDSAMRTYVNDTIYNSLPEEIRNSIIDTTVVSGHGITSGEANFTTTDKLYLLSTQEVWENGTSNFISFDTARGVTRQLDYYANLGVTSNNYFGAIKKYNGTASSWWLRSANSRYINGFFAVNYFGDFVDLYYAGSTIGVAPAFRLG